MLIHDRIVSRRTPLDAIRRQRGEAAAVLEHGQPRADITADVDGTTATVRLYDVIDSWGGYWGISAKEFAGMLDELPADVDTIELHINCLGGEVFEGIAILNALRNHPATVVAVVDGLAASAASFIACGCDELVMARNSELMIHDAWGVCVGNADDMTQMAEMLGRLSDNIASIYAEKAGGTLDEWRAAMARESWYSAEEAVEVGLADRVDTKDDDGGEAKAKLDLSMFHYGGRNAAPAPTTKAATPPPAPAPAPIDEPAIVPAAEAAIDPMAAARFRNLVATTRT